MLKRFAVFVLIIISFLLGFAMSSNNRLGELPQPVPMGQASSTVAIIINPGNGYAQVVPKVELLPDDTAFMVLDRALKETGDELSYKDYGGSMGVFITSIASTTNSKNKWWQYWVNGQYADVGVSTYKPKAEDVIEFRLTNERQ